MKFFSNIFNKKKFNIKLILSSTCAVSVLGIGYYLNQNQSPLFSYSFLNDDLVYDDRFKKCNRLINQYKEQHGIPSVIVGVSYNNNVIYSKAVGYSDVENNIKATPYTVARIASISKPIACAIAAKLYENGKLDLDKPIDEYLLNLPSLKYNGQEYKVTSRQLMCHTSGIRHYKDENDKSNEKDTDFKEFYLNKNFKTTREALEIFINDNLKHEPGTKHLYTTFGYTLLSAVIEKAANDAPFSKLLEELFKKFNMNNSYLDKNDPLIPNRSKYYMRNEKKKLINVPYVDNSYKWAGGGVLSNVFDLIKFGNLMLKFYQSEDKDNTFLKSSTVKSLMWSTQSIPDKNENNNSMSPSNDNVTYGLGWCLSFDEFNKLKYVYHTGGAVGATSCLLIVPNEVSPTSNKKIPNGLVVSVLCNSQDANEIVKFTLNIARLFNDQI